MIRDENTPLTVAEQHLVTNYIKYGNIAEAMRATPEIDTEGKSNNALKCSGDRILNRPNVKAEYNRVLQELRADAQKETTATAREVLAYFTAVMRGEIKDQFGLEAPLAERTKAAQELAKRTIDIENRQKGTPDQKIEIKLDWDRR